MGNGDNLCVNIIHPYLAIQPLMFDTDGDSEI